MPLRLRHTQNNYLNIIIIKNEHTLKLEKPLTEGKKTTVKEKIIHYQNWYKENKKKKRAVTIELLL